MIKIKAIFLTSNWKPSIQLKVQCMWGCLTCAVSFGYLTYKIAYDAVHERTRSHSENTKVLKRRKTDAERRDQNIYRQLQYSRWSSQRDQVVEVMCTKFVCIKRGNFRDFVFWYLPQIQYKNPDVQISTFKNMTPSPFIRCFYGTTHMYVVSLVDIVRVKFLMYAPSYLFCYVHRIYNANVHIL